MSEFIQNIKYTTKDGKEFIELFPTSIREYEHRLNQLKDDLNILTITEGRGEIQ